METLVKEKILEQFVKEVPRESSTIQPINVDIKRVNVTTMPTIKTLTTNDNNYFIRYGGGDSGTSYRAIEVYSINSINNDEPLYVFDNILIEGNSIFILELKQDEDGRFYGIGRYYDGTFFNNYLIIFNNFIEDGFLKINKYYSATNIGVSIDRTFINVTKMSSTGIYFLNTGMELVKFEINILEGNKTSFASVVDGGTITSGTFKSQLNIYKGKLIYTKLWDTDDYKYEYTKAIIDVNEELPETITLTQVYYASRNSSQYVYGAKNAPFKAIIPWLNTSKQILFTTIDLDGTVITRQNITRTFNNNINLYAHLEGNFASVTDNTNIYLFYFDENAGLRGLTEFYNGTFGGYYSNTQILKKYNTINLIGTAYVGTQQSIVSIKNIYSPNTTSLPYYTDMFCLPAYMNLYADSNDNTSLIFSRDATARFYSGNQVISTFIVPNYLLNDGNIEKASVYGKTNYLLNDTIEDYEKNRFESLYFNFIYNLNVIDNTNGLNSLNQIGSNRIADTLWKSFIPMLSRLSKARITYEDLSTEIIRLNLVSLIGGTATFNYQVSGNIVKIEYLSEDERTVYSTYRGQITGNHTITQVVKIIPNGTATLSGTSIYISDSSNLTFANIQINGNSVQNGTPTTSSPIAIKNAGGIINYFNKETILANHLINSNGTITEDSYNFVSDYIEVDSNTKYTISAATNKAKRIAYYNDSQTFISRSVISNYSGTITTPSNAKYIRLSCHNDDLNSLQLEKGSFVSSYVPYYNRMAKITETISNSDNTQSQSYTIPCQQPMRSIGNVRDEFIKQDGLWYEKHNIGVVESYNGETITTDYMSTTGSLSTGAFVQYVLDDANYIECTQEQIEALESIIRGNTYEPITNINSTDETPAYLNVTYYKQL